MPSHTICCTCGNILKLANAVAGAKAVCSRCQKVWTVPELPNAPQVPAPALSRRPIVVRKSSSHVGAIAVIAIIVIGGFPAIFFLKGKSEVAPPSQPVAKAPLPPLPPPDPPLRAPRGADPHPITLPPPPPPKSPPPPAPVASPLPADAPLPAREVMANQDLQAELDLLIYRINTTALTARVLELRGKKAEAEPLHESLKKFDVELSGFLKRLEREGLKKHVPDHFLPGDKITHFGTQDFAKLGAEGSEKVLVRFLGGLKVGSRARIAVRRGDDFAELDVIYHTRPKELFSIIQVAGIVPGQGGDDKDPEKAAAPPEPPSKRLPEALKILTDALLRLPASDRERAAIILRESYAGARAPAVLFVAANYLAFTDEALGIDPAGSEALQAYFNAVKFVEMESFDRPRHLAALAELKARISAVRTANMPAAELLFRFAAAHAADSGAAEADVQKAGEGLGLRRTADDKRWGDALSVLKADIVAEILAGRPKDVWRRFDDTWRHHDDFGVRLLGAWLLATETFGRNNGGYDRVAAGLRTIGKGMSKAQIAHVEALADGVDALAKCVKCKGSGQITCPKCGGDGKLDVKCQKCDGKGTYEKGGGTVMCRECLGKGVHKDVDCACARTSGKLTCPDCKGKMWTLQLADADISKVATLKDCEACAGFGLPPVGVALSCPGCFGLGKTLVPASDPKKTLK
ncbi:MAG TPA: hypothetical protein VFC86_14205 [Planctomycetota bacterium]|nr:hypothetical protein [Planctomycetota bacterium]